jgi:hypothetical protein
MKTLRRTILGEVLRGLGEILRESINAKRISPAVGLLAFALLPAFSSTSTAVAQTASPTLSFAGAQTTVAGGLLYSPGVAADGAGNVFFADPKNNRVVKVPAGCSFSSCRTTVGSGLTDPVGVAVDGAGDVFIADSLESVFEVTPAGAQTAVGSNVIEPTAVAVDGAGDVFIIEAYKILVEVPASCLPGNCQTTLYDSSFDLLGIAADAKGDAFVTRVGSQEQVIELPAVGGSPITLPTSGLVPFGGQMGLAVDANGNVFTADTGNNRVGELPAGGGAQITLPASGLNQPTGVAVDLTGQTN